MSPGEERRCTRWRFMPGARRDRSESKCSISPKVPAFRSLDSARVSSRPSGTGGRVFTCRAAGRGWQNEISENNRGQ
jgi:hypothetical protein